MKPFRVKIPTLWRQAFPGLMLGAVVGRFSLWLQGAAFTLPDTLPLMLMAAVMVVLLHYCQPTMAGSSGVKAMNSWGYRRHVKWTDIESVGFGRLYLVQPSLKLIDCRGRAHWIAKDTKDLRGLHAVASEFGGAKHPLTVALETPLFAL